MSNRSSTGELFEINAEGGSHSRVVKLLSEPGKVKSAALFLMVTILATIFVFVRKRQLIKRILSAAFRLFRRASGQAAAITAQ